MTVWRVIVITIIAIFIGAWIETGIMIALAWLYRRFK